MWCGMLGTWFGTYFTCAVVKGPTLTGVCFLVVAFVSFVALVRITFQDEAPHDQG